MIRPDWQQRDFRPATFSNLLEAIKIRTVPSVINAPALMLQYKPAIAAMMIAQRARAPMFARGERHFPIAMRKSFPPFQLNDPAKTEIVRQVAHAPGQDRNFWMRQAAKRGFVKMIEMR